MGNIDKFFNSFPDALTEELSHSIFSNDIMNITPACNDTCPLLKKGNYFGDTIIFCGRRESNYRFASFRSGGSSYKIKLPRSEERRVGKECRSRMARAS